MYLRNIVEDKQENGDKPMTNNKHKPQVSAQLTTKQRQAAINAARPKLESFE